MSSIEMEKEDRVLALGLHSVIIAGSLGIVMYAFSASVGGADWSKWLRYVGFSLLLASAGFATGGLFGFLFGIPKTDDESTNTSLEQISDWLTKILVGAGLAQLTVLPGWAWRVSGLLGQSFDGSPAAAGFVLCLSVFHTIAGFVIIYLWTRAYLPGILSRALREKKQLKIELRNVEEKEQTSRDLLAQATNRLAQEGQKLPIRPAADSELPVRVPPGRDSDDPWKGQFDGRHEANGRRLSAQVRPRPDNDELFDVQLRVESVDKGRPLQGNVIFFLHPTFRDHKILVEVRDNVAELSVTAWGAFTVGAVADNGKTLLELDLSELKDAPRKFRDR